MRRITPSFVIAVVALVLSCTGGAVAAGYITTTQVKDNSLTGKDIRNKSLSAADFKGSVKGDDGADGLDGKPGLTGPAGVIGPAGPAGPQGVPGVSGITAVDGPSGSLGPNSSVVSFSATCPAGTTPVGTGFFASIAHVGFVKVFGSSVGGAFFNDTGATATNIHVQAICANVGGARSAVRSSRTDDMAALRQATADFAATRE